MQKDFVLDFIVLCGEDFIFKTQITFISIKFAIKSVIGIEKTACKKDLYFTTFVNDFSSKKIISLIKEND